MAGEGMMEEIQDTGTWEERKYPLGTEEGNREAAGLDDDIPRDRTVHQPAGLAAAAGLHRRAPVQPGAGLRDLHRPVRCARGCRAIPFTAVGEVRDGIAGRGRRASPVGDRILAVDGEPVADWDDVSWRRGAGSQPAPGAARRRSRSRSARGDERLDLALPPEFDAERRASGSSACEPWNTTVGLVQKGGPADAAGPAGTAT